MSVDASPWVGSASARDGTWQYDVADDGFHHRTPAETPSAPQADTLALVYAVEPAKVLAFGKGQGGFSHTRYLPADR